MGNQQDDMQGIAAIVLASVLWGTTGTAASFAPAVSPLATGAFAMGGGGVLLVLHALRFLLKDRARLKACYAVLLTGGAAVALYPLAFYSAMRLSGVAMGTVISIASAPLFAVVLERLIGKKQVSSRWILGFITGGLGILLLTWGKEPQSVEGGNEWQYIGAALGLLAGLTYAVYSWSARRLIEQGIHARAAMAAMFGLAALVLLPSLAITGDNLLTTPIHASVALYMAVVPMFIGYLCFSRGLRQVEASTATLITLLEPVVAVMLAVLIVGERFMPVGWLGVMLIMLSLLLQTVRRRPGGIKSR
ncbi:DMT family transporter [Marinobacterium iners]|uniref:Drug/metabolite transporter, DME family n=1 Tax=Marinobacterium iners DSM 11526 TaxID=1122198 RepID=A0A1H4H403_9GAMM|nr:EamA family transporter [Marinobacterium iners]SEB15818.1 drug/metabolite transporter, DME family [Marinobacterium iners DSM 11526]